MRSLVIALMIALLPLRGWVGDAMAQTAVTPPMQLGAHAAVSHHDCAVHSTGANVAQDNGTDQNDGCSVCQVCHTLALEAAAPVQALQDPARIVVSLATPAFASAERALSVKPPIA